MAKYTTFFIVLITLFSCSKNDDKDEPDPTTHFGIITFTLDDSTYNWKHVITASSDSFMIMSIEGSAANGGYNLIATTETNTQILPTKGMFLPISSPILAINTPYTYTNTTDLPYPFAMVNIASDTASSSVIRFMAFPGDHVTMTLTKINEIRADGTFTAQLTRESDHTKVNITEGRFENVRVIER